MAHSVLQYETYEEWLRLRDTGIGGSDAGSIYGVNPWHSADEVMQRKLGLLPPVEDNWPMAVGRALEPVVADWMAAELGVDLTEPEGMYVHADYPWMLASVDRIQPDSLDTIYECKATGSRVWATPPDYYIAQVQHYMAVTGAEMAYIGCIHAGKIFRLYEVPRDDFYIDDLITAEKSFYEIWQERKEKGEII